MLRIMLFIVLMFSLSCQKDNSYVVNGRVVSEYSGHPICKASVFLVSNKKINPNIEVVFTDSLGNFRLHIPKTDWKEYSNEIYASCMGYSEVFQPTLKNKREYLIKAKLASITFIPDTTSSVPCDTEAIFFKWNSMLPSPLYYEDYYLKKIEDIVLVTAVDFNSKKKPSKTYQNSDKYDAIDSLLTLLKPGEYRGICGFDPGFFYIANRNSSITIRGFIPAEGKYSSELKQLMKLAFEFRQSVAP